MKRVFHLISSMMSGDGPSSGILAQITFQDKNKFQSSVWSLYSPPSNRNLQSAIQQAGANYKTFDMGASFLDARILFQLVRQLRQYRPDILHCHLVRANLYGRIAAVIACVPVVISTLRNVEEYMTGDDIVSRAVRKVEYLTAGLVSKYVAVSENVRQSAVASLQLIPNQIITILNAVDFSPFCQIAEDRACIRAELNLQPDDIVVGSVGRLHRQKNYSFLIKLAQTLCTVFEKVYFVIVGEGEERQALDLMVAELGLRERVLLIGFRSDIPRLLQAFDIFVLPSLYEGLPRAVMEAMSVGLPCVVTDVGGNAEAVIHGETGFVWPVGDFASFASSLENLLRNPSLRNAMGLAGRARAQKVFSANRMAQQYEYLYMSLLERATAAGFN
jgi:glycosyltransferase involved in cell wall biosynthesis